MSEHGVEKQSSSRVPGCAAESSRDAAAEGELRSKTSGVLGRTKDAAPALGAADESLGEQARRAAQEAKEKGEGG